MFILSRVIFWCLERWWLCRCVWPNGDDGVDVVFCVVNVVLDVVMVVICCCCDYGEMW